MCGCQAVAVSMVKEVDGDSVGEAKDESKDDAGLRRLKETGIYAPANPLKDLKHKNSH